MSNPTLSNKMAKASIQTPAKAPVASSKRELEGEDKLVYGELLQRYKVAKNDNIKMNIKACMDFVQEKRAPASGDEVLWAFDGKAQMCSWKQHCQLWANDYVKRKNRDEMIILVSASPEIDLSGIHI
jgi:hypothetical protein